MNVRSSTRATSPGSEWAQKLFGRLAGSSGVNVPDVDQLLRRARSYSSSEPSHQWIASGWRTRRPALDPLRGASRCRWWPLIVHVLR